MKTQRTSLRRALALLLSVLMLAAMLAACGSGTAEAPRSTGSCSRCPCRSGKGSR